MVEMKLILDAINVLGEFKEYPWYGQDTTELSAEECYAVQVLLMALPEALARAERAEAENADLKQSVISFCAPWAVDYAKRIGLPDGHMHPTHYDILAKCGARMDAFTRAVIAEAT